MAMATAMALALAPEPTLGGPGRRFAGAELSTMRRAIAMEKPCASHALHLDVGHLVVAHLDACFIWL